ncbi:hypothetical protein RAS1_19460 [Phycisphaerae bacterium RAS1]|nr:hypothetical protein RAS1_19460 [Phycisphaerae bacterium RAS1]
MRFPTLTRLSPALAAAAFAASAADAQTVRQAAGLAAADIQAAVDQYRLDLGALNPNNPGSFGSGRREINWDAVPDAFAAPNAFPADFFNQSTPGRARGVLFGTPGTGFQVSADADNPTATPKDFANIDASYLGEFEAFSPERLFTSLGSNVTRVDFFIPGSNTPATTRGFGSVFSDVDLANETKIEYFDSNDQLIFTALVPAAGIAHQSFSFTGVSFVDAMVAHVIITSGDENLADGVVDDPEGDGRIVPVDLVVMDDFIYGEPVPEPSSLLLLAGGLLAFGRRMLGR